MSPREVDIRAGYSDGIDRQAGSVTRRILKEKYTTTDINTAEKILEAAGGAIWEVSDYGEGVSRNIRLRYVACACGCGEKTLSHYIDVRSNGKHRWRKKVGLAANKSSDNKYHDKVFIRGHKGRTMELRTRFAETTARAWTPERRQRHAERIRALHRAGKYPRSV